jgi:hypothetical protein
MNNFTELAKQGLPLKEALIIDVHCHMGRFFSLSVPVFTVKKMLGCMDNLGIDIACISHHSAITSDYIFGNNLVVEILRKYPKRFLGYCTINPHYPEDIKAELVRCFSFHGIMGIKLHPSIHQVPVDYKNYHLAYEAADEKHCPVLVHTWGKTAVSEIGRIAGMYPNAVFIMAHSGGDVRAMENAIDVVNKHKNVYADLAVSRTMEGNVEWLVKEMGANKVLYGSDMPLLDPGPALGRVAMADLDEKDKRKIFGLNIKGILSKIQHALPHL